MIILVLEEQRQMQINGKREAESCCLRFSQKSPPTLSERNNFIPMKKAI